MLRLTEPQYAVLKGHALAPRQRCCDREALHTRSAMSLEEEMGHFHPLVAHSTAGAQCMALSAAGKVGLGAPEPTRRTLRVPPPLKESPF